MGTLRQVFWVVAAAVVVVYLFFLVLGAISIGDAVWLTLVVGVLAALWVAHALLQRTGDDHDPRLTSARERRGF